MLEIARYRHEHIIETDLRMETILNEKLSSIVKSTKSREEKLFNICRTLQSHISFDYVTAGFNFIADTPDQALSFLRIGFDEYQKIGVNELLTIARLKMKDLSAVVKDGLLDELLSDTFGTKSCTSLRLYLPNGRPFTFSFYSRQPNNYINDYTPLLTHLQKAIITFLESIFTEGKINTGTAAPHLSTSFNSYDTPGFEGIVGKSPLLLNVFDLISQVAPSDTSVLILGESGTGKERIADCIHNLSPRKGKSFVKVNCATLPANLIESELFGHEKGAFTGALEKRIGKFERADKGTIFLDEIGEMPIDLQVKLLRVLQEKYIERIGAADVTKVDVRIIAATNRNLEKEVAERRFRLDLYYRLNVFPIELPSLRERKDDIPSLANHFIKYYNHKAGKKISGLSDRALKTLEAYSWPGNIRELENLIERGVLLAKGTIIEDISLPYSVKNEMSLAVSDSGLKTIDEHERDYIISVLKKSGGRIWGAGGAAELLKMPPSTLKSKIKKLGIDTKDIG